MQDYYSSIRGEEELIRNLMIIPKIGIKIIDKINKIIKEEFFRISWFRENLGIVN